MPEQRHTRTPLLLEIPVRRSWRLTHVVLDFNGTLALDGKLLAGVKTKLRELSQRFVLVVCRADTHGNARRCLRSLPVELKIVATGHDKPGVLSTNLWKSAVAIGNGCNDAAMFRCARLSIAVLGLEGAASEVLRHADVVTSNVLDALDLLLYPKRLVATLRT
ncbi:MAG: HAD family hydrolase [Gammaproteobacteria bacterium]